MMDKYVKFVKEISEMTIPTSYRQAQNKCRSLKTEATKLLPVEPIEKVALVEKAAPVEELQETDFKETHPVVDIKEEFDEEEKEEKTDIVEERPLSEAMETEKPHANIGRMASERPLRDYSKAEIIGKEKDDDEKTDEDKNEKKPMKRGSRK